MASQGIIPASYAQKLDAQDPLARFRNEFHIAGSVENESNYDPIYLCGNSLGCMPKQVKQAMNEELDKWAAIGVDGHMTGKRPWVSIDEKSAELLKPIVGAKENEVSVLGTLSMNCHLLLTSFYRPTPHRYKILIESDAFCSDHHIIRSQLKLHDLTEEEALIEIAPREGETCVRTEDIVQKIREEGDQIATVFIGGVNFLTGQLYDMKTITKVGHEKGCYVGFDLAHCVGNVPTKLHDWNVDFAAWCHYKYVNSGAGCVAGIFVHQRHHHRTDLKRLEGWWGQTVDTRFKMGKHHDSKPGAFGYMLSNPPMFPVVCLETSLKIFNEAGMENIRIKSIKLTNYLEQLLETYLPEVKILSPRDSQWRGAQLSIRFPIGVEKAHELLSKRNVVCDIRRPDVMRIAPAPLYNSFMDVRNFVCRLLEVRHFWLKTNRSKL